MFNSSNFQVKTNDSSIITQVKHKTLLKFELHQLRSELMIILSLCQTTHWVGLAYYQLIVQSTGRQTCRCTDTLFRLRNNYSLPDVRMEETTIASCLVSSDCGLKSRAFVPERMLTIIQSRLFMTRRVYHCKWYIKFEFRCKD